jgi:hypothetical protein
MQSEIRANVPLNNVKLLDQGLANNGGPNQIGNFFGSIAGTGQQLTGSTSNSNVFDNAQNPNYSNLDALGQVINYDPSPEVLQGLGRNYLNGMGGLSNDFYSYNVLSNGNNVGAFGLGAGPWAYGMANAGRFSVGLDGGNFSTGSMGSGLINPNTIGAGVGFINPGIIGAGGLNSGNVNASAIGAGGNSGVVGSSMINSGTGVSSGAIGSEAGVNSGVIGAGVNSSAIGTGINSGAIGAGVNLSAVGSSMTNSMVISNVADFLERADRLAGRLVANPEFPQFYGKPKCDLVSVAQEMLFEEYRRAGGLSGGSGMMPSFTGVYPLAGMSYGTSGLGLPSGMIEAGGMGMA